MEIIFKILCGLLYCVGLPFGWSYQTTSIYICIYLWPILCTLSTLPIVWQSVKLTRRKPVMGMIFTIISLVYTSCYALFTIDAINRYNISNPNSFTNCMIDLLSLAAYLGITYETLNILIYVVLFVVIISINYILSKIISKYNKKLNKL